jgi:hypothetical protein
VFKIVKPLLVAAELSGSYGAIGDKVYSWNPDVDYREWPWLQIRRVGGPRDLKRPLSLGFPVIEMTARSDVGLPETEQLYEDALEVLYEAVRRQTQTPDGYLHSMKETLGATEFSSEFQDSWRIQGLIRLGIRPPRSIP